MALGVLGDVHGRIGCAQQRVPGCAVFGIEGYSNAGSAAKHVPFYSEGGVETALEALGDFVEGRPAADYGNEGCEFVSAETGEHIARS